MELAFKDKRSTDIFKTTNGDIKPEEANYFLSQMDKDKEIQVSSKPLDIDYLEEIIKKTPKKISQNEDLKKDILPSSSLNQSQLNRIEQKQNAMLEILETMPQPTVKQVITKDRSKNAEEILKLNLELFNKKLTILSTNTDDKYITNLLTSLEEISEHLISNSFYIFTLETSPVKAALNNISKLGLGDSTLNSNIDQAEKLLNDINTFAKMQPFEQSYSFSNLLLEKGLLLNAITLLNEVTSMYMIESIKQYSKDISKYITLIGEENKSKLYSRAKDYFEALFSRDSTDVVTIALFPHHKIVKDIDKEIARKLRNIERTWKNKGGEELFRKYVYIMNRIRRIRNSVAHADMQISFKSIKSELKNLNDDFYYLAVKKNIFKKQ
jgi:hypothetical protein